MVLGFVDAAPACVTMNEIVPATNSTNSTFRTMKMLFLDRIIEYITYRAKIFSEFYVTILTI